MEKGNFEDRSDLKISGAGKFSGGKYNSVKVSGAGDIQGDLDCVDFKCSGSAQVNGNVNCTEFKISGDSNVKGDVKSSQVSVSGACNINGNVISDRIKVSGDSRIGGDLSIGKLEISGNTKVGGNIKGENVKIYGGIKIGGNCEVEDFKCCGEFQIGEMLNAEKIEINPFGECKTPEIGGKEIEIKLKNNNFSFINLIRFVSVGRSRVICDTIEGDNIYLEATTAKIVRGKNITIGEKCDIDLVEYSDSINIINGANVKQQNKL